VWSTTTSCASDPGSFRGLRRPPGSPRGWRMLLGCRWSEGCEHTVLAVLRRRDIRHGVRCLASRTTRSARRGCPFGPAGRFAVFIDAGCEDTVTSRSCTDATSATASTPRGPAQTRHPPRRLLPRVAHHTVGASGNGAPRHTRLCGRGARVSPRSCRGHSRGRELESRGRDARRPCSTVVSPTACSASSVVCLAHEGKVLVARRCVRRIERRVQCVERRVPVSLRADHAERPAGSRGVARRA
jgi:hypothetical protein